MSNIFGFNKEKKTDRDDKAQPLESTSAFSRFQVFLAKLDERAQEIVKDVEESAQIIADADTDPYKRSFLQFKSAILAQFTQIIQKASATYQTKVIPAARGMEMLEIAPFYGDWNARMVDTMQKLFHGVLERDLEKEYAQAMDEYNSAVHTFSCMQCGAKLEIDKFYFQSSYITCTYCQTQNTFNPGTKARMIEHIVQPLARARCRESYQLYKEKKELTSKKDAKKEFHAYLDALIDEMNAILPGMSQQHENYRTRMLADFENEILPW
ncbi:hypothetical protein [Sphingobacterium sp. JB170]|uniref:hypothetical protein n=1 Tax=Sphingobacterium sp. JB170 TaxID=1434842 RepID=UPI00097EB0C5|nr:hypothetical protein [Sphingobacterium sp. JB170]SJN37265.1 hypothetical protein FM107_09265 [Sphingobacterium sp. JB170]